MEISETIGFTGSSRGMNPSQRALLKEFLTDMFIRGYRKFRHGDCIGSDAQAARIAKDIGFYLIAHPGHPKDPNETKYRAFTDFNDEVLPIKPFIKRDHDIVNSSNFMVAAPHTDYEILRSGTWTTVRYAFTKSRVVAFVYPNKNRVTVHK